MAVGDDATKAGYPIVPDTGEEGRVRWGAREINRTRDMIALVVAMIPKGMSGTRSQAKISYGGGTPGPNDGVEGEIWFRV